MIATEIVYTICLRIHYIYFYKYNLYVSNNPDTPALITTNLVHETHLKIHIIMVLIIIILDYFV